MMMGGSPGPGQAGCQPSGPTEGTYTTTPSPGSTTPTRPGGGPPLKCQQTPTPTPVFWLAQAVTVSGPAPTGPRTSMMGTWTGPPSPPSAAQEGTRSSRKAAARPEIG